MINITEQWTQLPTWLTNLDPSVYFSDNYVVLDFETTNINKGHWREKENDLLLSGFLEVRDGRASYRAIEGSEFDAGELVDILDRCSFLVAHNAQFELGWLSRCGFDISSKPVFCTQIAEHVISGNRQYRVGLDACLTRRGFDQKESVVSLLIDKGVCPSQIPISWLKKYCMIDVISCHKLFLDQRDYLEENGLLAALFCRCMLTAPLADIATQGMYLDKNKVHELYGEHTQQLAILEQQFNEFTGGINPKSSKQMREYLFDTMGFEPATDYKGDPITTPKGEYSTSTEALNALKCKNKKQREFVALRNKIVKLRDAISKYLRHFYNAVEDNEQPIIYANFNQTTTQTHRLSSTGSGIQFQNIDNRFKPAITCRTDDWWVLERDFSQLEYRIAVDLGKDKAGLESIRENKDRHGISASVIYEKEWKTEQDPNKRKEIRRQSKKYTFKPLFGGTSGTKAQKKYYRAFKEEHIGITSWQEDNKTEVLRTGKLRIPSGLIFYWPDTRVTHSGYVINTASICNYPVQSFSGADIVPIGVAFSWHRIRQAKLRSFITNTVHDCILSEVHPDEVNDVDKITEHAMTKDVIYALEKLYNYKLKVPLETEAEYTKNWGDSSQQLEVD